MPHKIKVVNKKIIKWARTSAGFNLEDVVIYGGAPSMQTLENWEQGTDYPTYAQLEKLAELFERPLVLFFQKKVPKEEPVKFHLYEG